MELKNQAEELKIQAKELEMVNEVSTKGVPIGETGQRITLPYDMEKTIGSYITGSGGKKSKKTRKNKKRKSRKSRKSKKSKKSRR